MRCYWHSLWFWRSGFFEVLVQDMCKRIFTALLLSLVCVLSSFAQDALKSGIPLMTHAEALRRVKEDSNEVRIAEISKIAAKDEAIGAEVSGLIPSISVTGSLVGLQKILTASVDNLLIERWSDPSVTATASLTFGSTAITSFITSAIKKKLADFTYDNTVANLEKAVSSAYWGVSAAQEALLAAEDSLSVSQEALKNVQARFDAGLASSLDLMNAKLMVANAESAVMKCKKAKSTVYLTLKSLVDADYDFKVERLIEIDLLELPSADRIYNKYLATNSTLRQLALTRDIANSVYDAVNIGTRTPKVTVGVGYRYGPPSTNEYGTTYDVFQFSVNASLSLDGFIPYTTAYNNITKAKHEAHIARAKFDAGYQTYRKDVESNIEEIDILGKAYEAAKIKAEYAKEALRLSKDAYDSGKISVHDYMNSIDSDFLARSALLAAMLDYRNAVFSFSVYLGQDYHHFISDYIRKK